MPDLKTSSLSCCRGSEIGRRFVFSMVRSAAWTCTGRVGVTFSAASASSVSVSKQEWYSFVFAFGSPALIEWVGLLEVYHISVVELTLVLLVILV